MRGFLGLILMMTATSALAFDPEDLKRLKITKECEKCDLSGASLRGAKPKNWSHQKRVKPKQRVGKRRRVIRNGR